MNLSACAPPHFATRTGERPMRTHNPTCLEGPITGTRSWWPMAESDRTPAPANPDGGAGATLFRAGLVAEVRREIAAGTYDTEEKWEIALDRLLKRLEEGAAE